MVDDGPLIPPTSADSIEPTKPAKKSGAYYRAQRKEREAEGGASDRVKPAGSKPKARPRAGTRAAREQTVAGQLMMLSAMLQGFALMSGDGGASALSKDAATILKHSDDVSKGLADAAQVSAFVAKLLDGSKDATALGTVAAALAPLMFEIAGNHGLIGGADALAG